MPLKTSVSWSVGVAENIFSRAPNLLLPIHFLTLAAAQSGRNSKAGIPGEAYFSKTESLIEDHYVRGELFFEFSQDAGKDQKDATSTLSSWCNNNR